MDAKLLTVRVLIQPGQDVALVTDALNDTFRIGMPGLVLDWLYDDTNPWGIDPPTLTVPDNYQEGDFIDLIPDSINRRDTCEVCGTGTKGLKTLDTEYSDGTPTQVRICRPCRDARANTCQLPDCPDRGKYYDRHSLNSLQWPGQHGRDRRTQPEVQP